MCVCVCMCMYEYTYINKCTHKCTDIHTSTPKVGRGAEVIVKNRITLLLVK